MKNKSLACIALTSLLILASCGDAGEDRSLGGSDEDNNTNFGNGETLPSASPSATANPNQTANPSATPTGPTVSNARITSFIWKPESERDGNLVVLVNPIRVRVEVTGDISERLVDSGPSNNKGTTARSRHTGCSFGKNVIVEFFDSQNRPIPTRNGNLKLRIPDGCDREEF